MLRTLKPVVRQRIAIASGPGEAAENRQTDFGKSLGRDPADPVVQRSARIRQAAISQLNFDGLTAAPGQVVPDTNGAVGTTQYFQLVNTSLQIFDKITGSSIYGPVDVSTMWTGFSPCNTTDDNDVAVEFDQIANVWVVEQPVTPVNGPRYQCIAVSTTSDATGNYYRYVFPLPPNFPDGPKIGVWPDAYYLTVNEQVEAVYGPLGSYVCALDRANMLAGNQATAQCFQLGPSYHGLLPADLTGSVLPPTGAPNYLLNLGANSLNLWLFHVDWTNPSNTTLAGPTNIPVASYGMGCNASSACAPQLGTSQLLDVNGTRLMFRLGYRHFADGHESLVATHSVNTPSAVRWYEIQNPGGAPILFQQGTFAPDSNYRWMGSIGIDQMGDIALGYSVSSATMYPAIRYTGRLQSEPLNTLDAETSIIEGTGSEVGSNRWGDYSSMSIDPGDNCTFWYTNEYFATSGDYNWHTRIASFSYPFCTSNPAVTLSSNGLYFGALSVGTASPAQTVTLTNQQSVSLNIASVVASGDYSESDNCLSKSPIPAGGTCSINITSTPTTSGTRTGQVIISDDAPSGSAVVNMTGIGSAPAVSLAPASLKFSTLAESSSAVQSVKLTNTGVGSLVISSIASSGDYSETDNCVTSSPLAAGASCNISVTFSPSVTGSIAGAITINDNGVNGAPHRIRLSGNGEVTISVYPPSLTFALTSVGATSPPQFVTVSNNAASAQNISWMAGGNFNAVAGGASPCGSSLASGSGCTLAVTFSPTTNGTGGTVRGGLAVNDTASRLPFNPQSVNLIGTATGGPATNPLTFSPASLNFANVAIGSTYSVTAQMQNASSSPLTLSSLIASGEYLVTSAGASPCSSGLVLNPKAKCSFTVSLTPTTTGSILGSITMEDNANSGPSVQTYGVAAIGHWPITLAPATLSFPATTVGSTSTPLQVTVTNYSPVAVSLYSFVASGQYTTVAFGTNQCIPTTVLNPRSSCTFGVSFSPTTTGSISGALTVTHNAPNGPQVLALTGSGR